MKHLHIYMSAAMLALSVWADCMAQGVRVYKKDGTVISIPYADLDSMVVTDRKVSDMDPNPKTYTVNGVSFTMIPVEGGTFTMGAILREDGDDIIKYTPHPTVTLSDYYIAQTEVTWALWDAVMEGVTHTGDMYQYPAQPKSWDDAQDFVTQLSYLTGQQFRLPTEAEWEFAARGGGKSKGYLYSGSNTAADVAWTSSSGGSFHKVATKQPNELGIYDMSGNVDEWVHDTYHSLYETGPLQDPQGPKDDDYEMKVYRGGRAARSESFSTVLIRQQNCQSCAFSGIRIAQSVKE